MNRKLLVGVVSGALALPMAASVQADATVYGSLRFGVQNDNTDTTDSKWTLGSNHSSRFGIKGSVEAGDGLTAGFHIERALNDGLTPRQHNVSLSGAFGTIKLGQQSSPYYGAVTWDGSNFLGGQTDFRLREPGVSYSSSLGGPFDFKVFASNQTGESAEGENLGDSAEHIEVTGSLAAGPVSLNVGYVDEVAGADRLGGTVGGAVAGIDWKVGYESGTDVATCTDGACNADRYGFHVGYAINGGGVGGGRAYVQFGEADSDNDTKDLHYWVFGYAHYIAEGVTAVAEHRTMDTNSSGSETTAARTVLGLKVDF